MTKDIAFSSLGSKNSGGNKFKSHQCFGTNYHNSFKSFYYSVIAESKIGCHKNLYLAANMLNKYHIPLTHNKHDVRDDIWLHQCFKHYN